MAAFMLGYRTPEDITTLIDSTFNAETDMHAELHGRRADSGYYVGTYADAVGLILWWSVANYAEGIEMIQRYESVQVARDYEEVTS